MRIFIACILASLLFVSEAQAAPPPDPVLAKAHAWVKAFMVKTAPPGRKIWYPVEQETEDEALVRYDDIAWDVIEVAYDPKTQPVFRSKDHGRSQTAAVWLGIMFQESGFMRHVDYNIGEHGRGDNGNSWCMMQLRIGKGRTVKWNWVHDRKPRWGDPQEEIFLGFKGEQLIEDRKNCIREGHKLVRSSFRTCRELPLQERLTAYAVGRCKAKPDDPEDLEYIDGGRAKSRQRMSIAIRYFEKTRRSRGFTDPQVTRALKDRRTPKKKPSLRVARNEG